MGVTETLENELGPDASSAAQRPRKPRAAGGNGKNPAIEAVNALDPESVADRLGIEHAGKRTTCLVCGATSGCDLMDHGIVCQHATCKSAGKGKAVKNATFYSCLDMIMLSRKCDLVAALQWAHDNFGTPAPTNGKKHHAEQEPPQGMFEDDPSLRDHPQALNDPEAEPVRIERIRTAQIFAPLPDPVCLVRGLELMFGRACCFGGYSYGLKSLGAMSAELAMAAGRPVWGHFGVPKPCRVWHVDQEQGKGGTLRRFQRLAKGMDIDPAKLGDRLEVSSFPPFYLAGTPDAVWERECKDFDLVVLDAVRGFLPGIDENDSAVQEYLTKLARISEKVETAFLTIHHAGKGDPDKRDERELLRGSSAIFAGLGAVWLFTGGRDEPKKVTQAKSHPEASGKMHDPFYLVVSDVERDGKKDGGLHIGYRTRDEMESGKAPEAKLQEMGRQLMEILMANPGISYTSLRARVEGDNTLVRPSLDDLERMGKVFRERRKGKGGGEVWTALGSEVANG